MIENMDGISSYLQFRWLNRLNPLTVSLSD